MEQIPILKTGAVLLVSIQEDMHDRMAVALRDNLANEIIRTRVRGVLIDLSGVGLVDSFTVRVLQNMAQVSRMLGAETVLVGMQPPVALTLVEMGLSIPGVRTALNVDKGMEVLEAALKSKETASDGSFVRNE